MLKIYDGTKFFSWKKRLGGTVMPRILLFNSSFFSPLERRRREGRKGNKMELIDGVERGWCG